MSDLAVQTIRIAVTGCETVDDVHKALDSGLYFIAGDIEHERTTPMTKPTAEEERAAVVAFMRSEAIDYENAGAEAARTRGNMADEYFARSDALRATLGAIERGDHHKGKD